MTTSMTPSQSDASPVAAVMRMVSDPSCDPSKLREILAARKEWMADEAAAAFNRAIVDFQREAVIVEKLDTANGRAYARMDRIWRTIRPLLDKCGLAITWESVKTSGDAVILDGHLRHSQGHAQPLHHEMPMPDVLKGQNAAQRAGSGETYAKRYAVCAALGIQTGDDDDGGRVVTPASSALVGEVRALITAAGKEEAKACQFLRVDKLENADAGALAKLKTQLERTTLESIA